MSTPALVARSLKKRYRRAEALVDCSFSIPAGSITALVGPNGAGKSTLMSIVAGLLAPDDGDVLVSGEPVGVGSDRSQLSFLAQSKPLYGRFTVAEMLRAGRSLNRTWDDAYAQRLITAAAVPMGATVRTLSGGQRTRVALALALARRPAVLVLDEPVADLDPIARQDVQQSIREEAAVTGTTVIISSHVVSELDQLCDRLLLLTSGRLRLSGPVAELIDGHRLVDADETGDAEVVGPVDVGPSARVLVRGTGDGEKPTLEDLTVAHLRRDVAMTGKVSS
ncbi:ABC transporter ATP-binding protein [Stackebrandtia soli]|uniref:ABC transporter ATP-binding protein n=1 Tax=Stackebrandtia soli TaxID=1892856 RepID=UPI0039E92FD5